jgi:hypothetical protein
LKQARAKQQEAIIRPVSDRLILEIIFLIKIPTSSAVSSNASQSKASGSLLASFLKRSMMHRGFTSKINLSEEQSAINNLINT